jgi:hypothetical protein
MPPKPQCGIVFNLFDRYARMRAEHRLVGNFRTKLSLEKLAAALSTSKAEQNNTSTIAGMFSGLFSSKVRGHIILLILCTVILLYFILNISLRLWRVAFALAPLGTDARCAVFMFARLACHQNDTIMRFSLHSLLAWYRFLAHSPLDLSLSLSV